MPLSSNIYSNLYLTWTYLVLAKIAKQIYDWKVSYSWSGFECYLKPLLGVGYSEKKINWTIDACCDRWARKQAIYFDRTYLNFRRYKSTATVGQISAEIPTSSERRRNLINGAFIECCRWSYRVYLAYLCMYRFYGAYNCYGSGLPGLRIRYCHCLFSVYMSYSRLLDLRMKGNRVLRQVKPTGEKSKVKMFGLISWGVISVFWYKPVKPSCCSRRVTLLYPCTLISLS